MADRPESRPRRIMASVLVGVLLVAAIGCSSGSDAGGKADGTSTVPARPGTPSTVPAPASARILQPAQPTSGPGGSELPNGDWRVSSGGEGADGWYVFEPVDPQPRTAPVAIVMHGYYEYDGYGSLYEFIRHTVRTGSIVIYPRWQTGVAAPCAGPIDIGPCLASATNGIRGAVAYLRAERSRVQPELGGASYFGFSFGGIITADLANRYEALHLPRPTAIFLDDPHDGGITGTDEPALDDSMAGIPSSVLFECHVGAHGVISEPGTAGASCNALFPKLSHIPARNKALVLTRPDDHGAPALTTPHGVCTAPEGEADAYDWNFCWRVWDALRSAATSGRDREFALGDTPQHRSNGEWSDGVAVAPLKIQTTAPIRP